MVPGAVTAATVHGLAWPLVQERLNYLDAKLKIGPNNWWPYVYHFNTIR